MDYEKKTLLVVDDQQGIRLLLQEVLQDAGYVVFTAANGYECLQRLEETRPDLILMDMKMPGMDGLETLRTIKSQNATQNVKVLMMTAYGELDLVKQAEQSGACGCLTKPFDIKALCRSIAEKLT